MGNNEFMPKFNDNGQDNVASFKGNLPDFDLHSIYKGVDNLPINASERNKPVISFGPVYAGNDRLTPYKLPQVEMTNPSGQSTLDDLNRRITDNATDNVQKHMTPEEKKDLNKDMAKYAEDMQKYEEHMKHVMMGTGGIGLDDPPPPKPASLVKYEEAIDAEIKKIVQHMG